ncbi:MAG: MarR family winged helix-turn-helix transcriptional regulator [Bellilinea sp.]
MAKSYKNELVKQVLIGARDYGISTALFRHAVGEILGVNVTDMECLALIFSKGLATPSELARYTGLTSGATTAMLDRLEKAHLIERRPNPQDRRSMLIVLTNETTDKMGAMFASGREANDKLTSSYSESELELIADYFRKLVRVGEEAREKLRQRNKI